MQNVIVTGRVHEAIARVTRLHVEYDIAHDDDKYIYLREFEEAQEDARRLVAARGIEVGDSVRFIRNGNETVGEVTGIDHGPDWSDDAMLEVRDVRDCTCGRQCCQGYTETYVEVWASRVLSVTIPQPIDPA